MSEASRAVFISQIAALAQKYAPEYNIKVVSPIIAQACKESAFGESELAVYARNYFGLKYKSNRCPGALSEPYVKVGSEQNADGSYTSAEMRWFKFRDMEACVKGYFDFINVPRYSKLKGLTDPRLYAEDLYEAGYASSLTYAQSLMDYIDKYGLTKYDSEVNGMGYTNSPLASYQKLSPCYSTRKYHIDTIIIHCYVGQVSVERMGQGWSTLTANASANYGIGTDGRVGLFVEEKNRAWTTGGKYTINGWSGSDYDHRAVTIECASDTVAPYAINDKVMQSLIRLCADICKRNDIKELKFKGDSNLIGRADLQNVACHRWFTPKSCPGDYIYNRLTMICSDVNQMLGVAPVTTDTLMYHTVVKGETLAKIANAYGTTYQAIAATNNIANPNKISVGQVLKILVRTNNIPTTYTVQSGDSLSKIAKANGITLAQLKALNPEVKAPLYIIRKGQVLKLK